MVLPPNLLESHKHSSIGCVEIIEFLTQSGFKIQGLKMVTFSMGVARELLELCDCLDTETVNEGTFVFIFYIYSLLQWCADVSITNLERIFPPPKVDNLCHGPCLILVVRRDNAASCCQTIFKR